MRSCTYTIHIDRSPEQVWAHLMDVSRLPNLKKEPERVPA